MKRSVYLSLASLLTCQASLLSAHENQPYLELGLGRSVGTGEIVHGGANSAGTPRYGINNATVRSFALGYQFISGLRLELDFRDRNIGLSDEVNVSTRPQSGFIGVPEEMFSLRGTMNSTSRMISAAYVGELIKPAWKAYVKAGAGESKNRTIAAVDIQPTFAQLGRDDDVDYEKGSNREFAWLVGAGVHLHMRDNVEVGLDYQYTNLGDATTQVSELGDQLQSDALAVHEVSIKLRFHF